MEDLLVSVIIPTFSRAKHIIRAIDSVLDQTYPNIEIIVVDDNGKGTKHQKETFDCLQSYIEKNKIIYLVHNVNKNGSAARNTGFRASRGQYVAFLDDDDVYMPNKIKRQVEYLNKYREFGACYCNSKYLTRKGEYGTTNYSKDGNLIKDYLLLKMIMNTSALLFRREVIEELGGFDESYVRHQDFELMTRFFEKKQLIKCCTGEPLLFLDWSGERTNQPNIERLIEVEEKFYSQFEPVLKMNGIWEEVHQLWYFNIFLKYLKQHKLKYAYNYLRKSYAYKQFSKYQMKVIVVNHIKLIWGGEIEA